MTATNPKQETDTLKVSQNEDGTFNLEWQPDDPKWAWLNNMTQEQVQIMLEKAIQDYLEEVKNG